jgi:hypothetical protein
VLYDGVAGINVSLLPQNVGPLPLFRQQPRRRNKITHLLGKDFLMIEMRPVDVSLFFASLILKAYTYT